MTNASYTLTGPWLFVWISISNNPTASKDSYWCDWLATRTLFAEAFSLPSARKTEERVKLAALALRLDPRRRVGGGHGVCFLISSLLWAVFVRDVVRSQLNQLISLAFFVLPWHHLLHPSFTLLYRVCSQLHITSDIVKNHCFNSPTRR